MKTAIFHGFLKIYPLGNNRYKVTYSDKVLCKKIRKKETISRYFMQNLHDARKNSPRITHITNGEITNQLIAELSVDRTKQIPVNT